MQKRKDIKGTSLNLLVLEDSLQDYELICEQLYDAGYNLKATHVKDKAGFVEALKQTGYDLVLSDFKLPDFDAFDALEVSQTVCPETPFICISGSIGENTAIELLKRGAVDYVLKDNPERLPYALKRALDEAKEKTDRRLAEIKIKESEQKFRSIFENHKVVMLIIDPKDGTIVDANQAAIIFYGYKLSELLGSNIDDINISRTEVAKSEMQKVQDDKKNRFEFRHKKANGDVVDVEVFSSAIDIAGKTFLHSIIHDVTEKKQAEADIHKLSMAIEQSPVSVVITNLDGKIEYVNPRFLSVTGYNREEVQGNNLNVLDLSMDNKAYHDNIWETISSGNVWKGELRSKKKSGELYWESVSVSPIKNKHGAVTHYIAVREDITDRKKAEESLAFSEEKFRIIAENTYNWEFWEGIDGSLIYVSPSFEKLTGYKVDNLLNNPKLMNRLIHPGDIDGYKKHKEQTSKCKGLYQCEFRIITKSGRVKYIEHVCQPAYDRNGQYMGIRGTNVNVTERKLAEEKLEANEAKFRTLIEQAAEMLFLHDTNGNIVEVNLASVKNTGYSKIELLSMNVFDIDPDASDRSDKTKFWKSMKANDAPVTFESRHRRKEGSIYHTEVTVSKIRLFRKLYILALARDITERKEAEEALLNERLLLRTIIDSLPDAIYVKDKQGRKVIANKADCFNMGISKEEDAIGKSDFDIWPAEIAQPFFDDDQQVLQKGEYVVKKEEKLVRPNGDVIWEQTTKLPLLNQENEIIGLVGVGHDITQQKKANTLIRKSLKEKEILLAEIHHRVKNNMAIISSLLTLQTDFDDHKKDPDTLIQDLKSRVMSMSLVHELVYESNNFAEIEAGKLVTRLASFLENIYKPKDKEISIQVESDNLLLNMNNSVPFALLVNEVVTNAYKHAFTDQKHGCISILLKKEGGGFRLTVQDDGKGVGNVKQLNHPQSFGYTIIHGLAGQLRGSLKFTSAKNGGMRVEALFPGEK